jgi:hypothetical protein
MVENIRGTDCKEVISWGRGAWTSQTLGRCQHLWSNWISVQYSGRQAHTHTRRTVEYRRPLLYFQERSLVYFFISVLLPVLFSHSFSFPSFKQSEARIYREIRQSYSLLSTSKRGHSDTNFLYIRRLYSTNCPSFHSVNGEMLSPISWSGGFSNLQDRKAFLTVNITRHERRTEFAMHFPCGIRTGDREIRNILTYMAAVVRARKI